MSTTTENGMGGPWSTSREKTYKKVKKKKSMTISEQPYCVWFYLPHKMNVNLLSYHLFWKGCCFKKSKRSFLLSLSHMSPYKCPSTALNVLTPARAACQRSVKCWSLLLSFLSFFLKKKNFRRHCLWQHFTIRRFSTVAVQVKSKHWSKLFLWWLQT